MHQLIYAVVRASSRPDAVSKATAVFDELRDDPSTMFDYYGLFDAELPERVRDQWGDLPEAARIESEEGSRLMDQAWSTVEKRTESSDSGEALEGPESTYVLVEESGAPITDHTRLMQIYESDDEYWVVPADIHY